MYHAVHDFVSSKLCNHNSCSSFLSHSPTDAFSCNFVWDSLTEPRICDLSAYRVEQSAARFAPYDPNDLLFGRRTWSQLLPGGRAPASNADLQDGSSDAVLNHRRDEPETGTCTALQSSLGSLLLSTDKKCYSAKVVQTNGWREHWFQACDLRCCPNYFSHKNIFTINPAAEVANIVAG